MCVCVCTCFRVQKKKVSEKMAENFVTQTWECLRRKEVPSLLFLSIAKVYLQLALRCLPDMFVSLQDNACGVLSRYDWFGQGMGPRCMGTVSFWELIRLGWGREKEHVGIRFLLPCISESLIDALEIPVLLKDYFRDENADMQCLAPREKGHLIRWTMDPNLNDRSLAIAMRRIFLCLKAKENRDFSCPFGFKKWRCVCMRAFFLKAKREGDLGLYGLIGSCLYSADEEEEEVELMVV